MTDSSVGSQSWQSPLMGRFCSAQSILGPNMKDSNCLWIKSLRDGGVVKSCCHPIAVLVAICSCRRKWHISDKQYNSALETHALMQICDSSRYVASLLHNMSMKSPRKGNGEYLCLLSHSRLSVCLNGCFRPDCRHPMHWRKSDAIFQPFFFIVSGQSEGRGMLKGIMLSRR